jgi:putative MATE family efflux protein
MKDLTKGPVSSHLLQLATFIALSTAFQTLYFLADLYFVGRLGKEAIAGVGLSGNLMFLVLALTQSLGVGATSLIAQAVGRKDPRRVELVFNQALVLSVLVGLAFGIGAFSLRVAYSRRLAADAGTAALGVQYLDWYVPALAAQFALVAMGAALRGIGDVKVPTAIQVGTVLLNIGLAPTLMFGWVGLPALGVAGAAIATLVAVLAGLLAFSAYFRREASPLRFRTADWQPQPRLWGEILRIGLPAGGEFALMSVYLVLVYDMIRPFGAAAQAGFGIGLRVVQSLFLPVVAIAFATAPVAGQNFGARLAERVRQSFYSAAGMATALMLALTVLCRSAPAAMVSAFNADAAVVAFGSEYLHVISLNFVASGIVFVASSVFQGMGNTLPALGCSFLRLLLFALPGYTLARRPSFQPRQLWYLSVASVTIQLGVSLWLLHREFARRLPASAEAVAAPAAAET